MSQKPVDLAAARHAAELDRLSDRINWLDRYRRPLSVLLAAIIGPLATWWLHGWLPSNWPVFHIGMLGITAVALAWYGIETFLGFVLAVWETDYAKATGPASLPRAEVIRRK